MQFCNLYIPSNFFSKKLNLRFSSACICETTQSFNCPNNYFANSYEEEKGQDFQFNYPNSQVSNLRHFIFFFRNVAVNLLVKINVKH